MESFKGFTQEIPSQTVGGGIVVRGGMPLYQERFADWGDMLHHINTARPNWPHGQYSGFGKPEWFETTLPLIERGWHEGEDVLKALSARLVDLTTSLIERPYYSFDVTGMDFDVARVVEGEPEAWRVEHAAVAEGSGRKFVRIMFNNTRSGGANTEATTRKGAAIVALAELLTVAGYGVEVGTVDTSGFDGAVAECYVTVKTADQPIDHARLMFALAHPLMLRAVMFAIEERYPVMRGFQRRGDLVDYGYAVESQDRGDIYVATSSLYRSDAGDFNSTDGVIRWVKTQLKAQGIALGEE